TNYYLSYANTNIDGIVPNNTYVKNNFKLSGRTVIGDDFTASANVNYLQNQGNRIQQGSNLSGLMLGLLRTPINFDNEYGYEFEDGTQRNYQGDNPGGFDNPYWVINNIAYKDNINRMIGNIELIYNPAPWINLTYRIGNDWYHSEVNDFFEKGSNAWSEGAVYKSHIYSRSLNSDIILSLNKEFGDLSTTLLLGQNLQEDSWKRLSGRSLGLELYDWNNIANSRDIQALEASSKARRAGLYGDLGLSYKSMVFLNFTARNDWSTTMPEGANSFFYPAVNLGFVFTSLPALEDNSILPYGKLRVSYGITGLDAREYATYTRWIVAGQGDGWTNGISFPFRGYSGFSVSSEIGNNLLKPEKQKTFEIGTDLRFINNLVRVDLGYFINNNENLLIPAPIAGSSGFGYKYMNIGSMQTKGIELVLGVTAIKTKDLSWEINLNFDNPNSVITYLADNTENISLGGFQDPQIHAVLDQPYRIIWGTQWLRDEDGNLVINDDSRNGTIGHPIQDVNTGNLGKFQPDYKIGLTNIVNYKGLTISALLDIKKGGQMWNGTKGALYYFGKHKDTETRDTETKLFEGRMGHLNEEGEIVHYEGIGMNKVEIDGLGEVNDTEVNMDESWYYYGPGSVFTGPVEDYVEKTDWFRLREVSVSYRFGDNLLQNIFIKKLEIYFTGQNLILITPYTGVDPETSLLGNGNAQGLDYFNMPGTKTYSFGIKLGF
ncbi:MAG: TonB-dependent receptor, partial [Bacteroidales bacterium]|nr:TonB-dependent receptor [Bacteroidales bacterium]